jgi:hypothetical protein
MDKFIFMLEWQDPVQYFTNEEKGILFQNLINYASGEPLNEENRQVNIAWNFMKPNIDRMNEKYLTDVLNGKKGGAPKGSTPWNKRTPSEPKANPQQTQSEGERTYKEKDKENYKEEIKVKEEVKEEVEVKINTNSLYDNNEFLKNSLLSNKETNTETNTHTREIDLSNLFQPQQDKVEPQHLYFNLTPDLQKEADRQAALAFENLLNK